MASEQPLDSLTLSEENLPQPASTSTTVAQPESRATSPVNLDENLDEDSWQKNQNVDEEIDWEDDDHSQLLEPSQQPVQQYAPTASLTLAAFSPYSDIPLARRFSLIASSVLVNLGLPFLNGIMLGFGEIFARVVLAPALGITGVGWSGDTSRATINAGSLFRRTPSNPASLSSSASHHRSSNGPHTLSAGRSGSADPAELSPDVGFHLTE